VLGSTAQLTSRDASAAVARSVAVSFHATRIRTFSRGAFNGASWSSPDGSLRSHEAGTNDSTWCPLST
jgi:hypothetical protein